MDDRKLEVSDKAKGLLNDVIRGKKAAIPAIQEYTASLEADKRRLDWMEKHAGRELLVREESDATVCNIYLAPPNDPIRGGVYASLRDAADRGMILISDNTGETAIISLSHGDDNA